MEDISERKLLGAKFGRTNQKLLQLAAKDDGVWILDDKGVTTYINSKMASMLCYSVDEILGNYFFDFLDGRGKAMAEEAGLPLGKIKDEKLEMEFIRGDGPPVYTLIETLPITDEVGSLAGLILHVSDISERKRVEQALLISQKKYSGLFQHRIDGFCLLSSFI